MKEELELTKKKMILSVDADNIIRKEVPPIGNGAPCHLSKGVHRQDGLLGGCERMMCENCIRLSEEIEVLEAENSELKI